MAPESAKIIAFRDSIQYVNDSIVSQQIIKNSSGNVTLFAFDKDQQLSEHSAPFDALVQVLDGTTEIRIAGKPYSLKSGEAIILPANVPHAVYASERFMMLLTMIKGQ